MSTDNVAFNAAVERINGLSKKPSDSELLELYALFKQGTVGDVNTERPGLLDFKGRAKWDAWNSKKAMSKADAQSKYIAYVEEIGAKYA